AYYGFVISNADAIGAAPTVLADQYIGPVYPPRVFGLGMQVSLYRRLTLDAQADYQGGAYLTNFIGYQNALRNVWQPCYGIQQKLRGTGPDGKVGTPDDVPGTTAGISAL